MSDHSPQLLDLQTVKLAKRDEETGLCLMTLRMQRRSTMAQSSQAQYENDGRRYWFEDELTESEQREFEDYLDSIHWEAQMAAPDGAGEDF